MIKGKIVLLPFPFDDFSSTKVRPCLCLTDLIGEHQHIIVAFISSQIKSDCLPTDIVLTPEHPDFELTGLHVSSTLQLHRLMTTSKNIIKRELGYLSLQLQKIVSHKLRELF